MNTVLHARSFLSSVLHAYLLFLNPRSVISNCWIDIVYWSAVCTLHTFLVILNTDGVSLHFVFSYCTLNIVDNIPSQV